MPLLNMSNYDRIRAQELWANLLDSRGEPERVSQLVENETVEDTPGQFTRVMSVALALQFAFAWPVILRMFEDCGVTHTQVLQEIEADLAVVVGDHLRRDVTEEEVM